jgi:arylsulfatase A-like enzyme
VNEVSFKRATRKKGPAISLITFLLLLALVLLVAFLFVSNKEDGNAEAHPNIILVSIDTLRADHIHGYGYGPQTTPFLDSLMRRGTSFSNAISPAPWTLPSHLSLFTSLYPHTHGVVHDQLALNDDVITLPMLLQRAGYQTGGFASCLYLFPGYGFDRGFDYYIERNEFPAPVLGNEAFDWLLQTEPGNFFLFLHFYDVHPPHDPQEKYLNMFESSYGGNLTGDVEDLLNARAGAVTLSDEDRRHLKALYDAEIREVDESLAAFMNALNGRGYLDNTLIIILSDHGEEFFDHGGVLHSRTLYDELIRIPLIVVGPGIPAGKRIEEQVQLIDVMPMILDACGIRPPREIEGKSLLPLISGDAADWEQVAFAEADKDNEKPDIKRAVRTEKYKFYYDRLTGEEYLFDLSLDPAETESILDAEPELGKMHREQLREWMDTKRGNPKKIVFTESEKELLRALGYLTGP